MYNEDKKNFIILTCGDWDLRSMLQSQCKYFKIDYPPYLKSWINVKKSFAEVTAHFPKGMMIMLNELNINHTGKWTIF